MKPADQVTLLQGLAGPGFAASLARIDAEIVEKTAERGAAKRALDRVGAISEVAKVEPVDVGALSAELEEIERFNSEQLAAENALRDIMREGNEAIVDLERCKLAVLVATDRLRANTAALEAAAKPQLPRSSVDLRASLVAAGETNRRAQEYRDALIRIEQRSDLARAANDADDAIRHLREQRAELQATVSLPVDGVAFDESGLRVGGLPFEQLSSSERIRISARIGMALGPQLRVMFIKDGSLLDDRSFAELKALAAERDYQLWVETVGPGHGDAIVLEAGEVKEPSAPDVGPAVEIGGAL